MKIPNGFAFWPESMQQNFLRQELNKRLRQYKAKPSDKKHQEIIELENVLAEFK